jgi:hypothetical protein
MNPAALCGWVDPRLAPSGGFLSRGSAIEGAAWMLPGDGI